MVMRPDTMFDHYGHEESCKMIDNFMEEKDLQMFAMMCNVMDPESHEILRYIFVYTRHDGEFAYMFEPLCEEIKKSDLLKVGAETSEGKYNNSEWASFVVNNLSVSRKKFEIVFRAFFNE